MKKNYMFLLALCGLMAWILVTNSCKFGNQNNKGTTTENPTDSVPLNPDFIKTPPIAEDILVEKIEGDSQHVLLLAKFSKDVFHDPTLAIDLDGEKIVLRDDGKGDDKIAGDGLYTVKVEESMANIESVVNAHNSRIDVAEPAVSFESRRMLVEDRKLKKISVEELHNLSKLSIVDITRFFPKFPLGPSTPPLVIDSSKSLMVTATSVVEDPTRTWNYCTQTGTADGPWTFGTLMRQMASHDPGHIATDADVSSFVLNWLKTWESDQTVNSELVAKRPNVDGTIITPWLNKSKAAGAPTGQLDMKFAPFRLMAIVNRVDLRGNSGYGPSSAGEGRFVFCLISPSGCGAMQFTVIFEYGVNKKGCSAVKAYAQQWANLSGMTLGSAAYNTALQAITDQFSKCGTNPSKPNQNSLDQLRTDEIALSGPWELREFHVVSPGQLSEVTVKQEPNEKFNGTIPGNTAADIATMAGYVNTNTTNIIKNTYTIPDAVSGQPFLGGVSHNRLGFWNGTVATGPGFITNSNARLNFSLNTCSGCHGGETNTTFTEIHPATFGTAAGLSGFLTGITVPDPAHRISTPSHYSDLQRRAIDLNHLISTPCRGIFGISHILTFKPVNMEG